jgi:hypothetical protein
VSAPFGRTFSRSPVTFTLRRTMDLDQLHALFVRICPAFAAHWDSAENYHRDGPTFTAHGLCAEFSSFFVANSMPLDERLATTLFAEVERLIADDPHDQSSIANALCTCFLENIAGTPAGAASLQFMGPTSLKHFSAWHGPS